jgi:GT2 family glycosyltransferase
MSTPDLTIIIVNFNSQYWLKKTLTTLKTYYLSKTKKKIEVVVVDNHSSDDSVAILKQEFKWVKLIELPENIGFAAGNNVALKEITSPYVMLLNSDVEFNDASNLDDLLEKMDRQPEIGVITPKVVMVNQELDLAAHRGEPTPWAAFTYFAGLEKLLPQLKLFSGYHQLYKNLEAEHAVDACSGAAMIVRTKAMNQVGLLDERFFMYAEDLDWCRRFRAAGFLIWYDPMVVVIHHKNKSGISSLSRQTALKTKAMFYDTMLQYYDKHYRQTYPNWVRSIIKTAILLKKGVI